jgi:hypothetical protein
VTHRVLAAGLALILSGCAVYKNPVSLQPPAFTPEELRARLSLNVAVHIPNETEFQSIKDPNMRRFRVDAAIAHANQLVSILRDCQVVNFVAAGETSDDIDDAVIVDLPMQVERTGMDDPMALIYGGVLPVYTKGERGIHFRFIKCGSGDFTFRWTESVVVAIWAPLIAAGNSKWETNRRSTKYWYDLRTELIRAFSSADHESNSLPIDGNDRVPVSTRKVAAR